jgi:hypothetical protein
MPQKALYELAEAALGLAPEMFWSLDENIARHESKRLFDRLAAQQTSPAAGLTVFLISMQNKRKASMDVVEERYSRVILRLTQEQQESCATLAEFFEFFTLASHNGEYVQSKDIAEHELAPLFEACYNGELSAKDTQDAVFDNVMAKRDLFLQSLQEMVQRLHQEMQQFFPAEEVESREDT